MTRKMQAAILAIVVLLFAAPSGAALALGDGSHPVASTRTAPRVCFPASHWAPAPDGLRPCVRVARLYEDGSFKAQVSDANGTIRYSVGVGNPQD